MPDLSNLTDLQEYLRCTPFASSKISPLSGGSGNFACRLQLLVPYKGHSTLVLKHGKPYKYEVEALKIIGASVPADSFITTPNVHLYDEKEAVIVMDDCGQHSITLKQFFLDGRCSLELAEKIGSELGEFLHRVHAINRKSNPTTCDLFAHNAEAKRISAFVTYGRLVSTLTGQDKLPALENPPLKIEDGDLQVIREASEKTMTLVMEARDAFVMGDFWPGNVLLSLDSPQGSVKGISIVDWELAKTGLPGLDLGQFTAEMDLLCKFSPSQAAASTRLLSAFHRTYSAEVEAARIALRHWGAHLIAWTPRVAWGGQDDTRDMVCRGVKLVVASAEVEDETVYGMLRQSK
ncbi:hypothetical protein D9757_002309 [Collybiopsis confluens]|uniref:Aminoglycoside phosphotransferase domain-containing protein n=1 Tax=Collybiopsis confluens TaxID=2823264 RepID=A0A8H5I087_9AGAR|nr:hypothetical protein D9757_002309 [Collybiopsis confluens]